MANQLKLVQKVKTLEGVRSNIDHRFIVDRHIYQYKDKHGDEYRKSWETKPTDEHTPPQTIRIQ